MGSIQDDLSRVTHHPTATRPARSGARLPAQLHDPSFLGRSGRDTVPEEVESFACVRLVLECSRGRTRGDELPPRFPSERPAARVTDDFTLLCADVPRM